MIINEIRKDLRSKGERLLLHLLEASILSNIEIRDQQLHALSSTPDVFNIDDVRNKIENDTCQPGKHDADECIRMNKNVIGWLQSKKQGYRVKLDPRDGSIIRVRRYKTGEDWGRVGKHTKNHHLPDVKNLNRTIVLSDEDRKVLDWIKDYMKHTPGEDDGQ